MQQKGKIYQSQLDVVVANMMATTQQRFSDRPVYKYLSIYPDKALKTKLFPCTPLRHIGEIKV
jgi:hypothetical protein